jgi:hypothetical protein
MDDELIGADVLPLATLGDEDLGQRGALLAGQQPADDVAAEDVELCGAPHNAEHF